VEKFLLYSVRTTYSSAGSLFYVYEILIIMSSTYNIVLQTVIYGPLAPSNNNVTSHTSTGCRKKTDAVLCGNDRQQTTSPSEDSLQLFEQQLEQTLPTVTVLTLFSNGNKSDESRVRPFNRRCRQRPVKPNPSGGAGTKSPTVKQTKQSHAAIGCRISPPPMVKRPSLKRPTKSSKPQNAGDENETKQQHWHESDYSLEP